MVRSIQEDCVGEMSNADIIGKGKVQGDGLCDHLTVEKCNSEGIKDLMDTQELHSLIGAICQGDLNLENHLKDLASIFKHGKKIQPSKEILFIWLNRLNDEKGIENNMNCFKRNDGLLLINDILFCF